MRTEAVYWLPEGRPRGRGQRLRGQGAASGSSWEAQVEAGAARRQTVLTARCSLHRSLVKPHSERGLSPWKPKKGQHLISEPTSFRTGASCENPSPQAQGSLGKATLCGTVQRAWLPRGSEVRELGRALPVWESPFHTEVLAGPRCRHGGPAPAHGDCQAPGAHTIGKPAPLQPQRIRESLPQRRAIHTPPLTLSATEAWSLEQW